MLWKPHEIRILKSSLTIDEMCAELPHRTRKSILNKRSKMGVTAPRWTADERSILQEYYEEEGEQIVERLPGKTWDAIRSQVYYLRKRGWKI
jgi:hypothetical protein